MNLSEGFFTMTIDDHSESYLINLDFNIHVNSDGMVVSYGGAPDNAADADFANHVGRASGEAMSRLVRERGEVVIIDPELLTERPSLKLGKEITTIIPAPDAPLDDSPLEATPPKRAFDLPPQHIIDAKTITVTETPIGPDGAPQEPVMVKRIELSPGITIPTPDNVNQQRLEVEAAVKSFIIPREFRERACNDSFNQLVEMYSGVLSQFIRMVDDDDPNLELEGTDSLMRHYIRMMQDQYSFIDEMCRDFLPVSVLDQAEQINDIVHDFEGILPLMSDPGLMARVGSFLQGAGVNTARFLEEATARGQEGLAFIANVIGGIAALLGVGGGRHAH